MNDRVSIAIDNHVADVRLTRADKMNALDPAMFQGIIAAGEELAAMKGLRAVVLSGEGRSFCAGLDMASMASGGASASSGMGSLTDRMATPTHSSKSRCFGANFQCQSSRLSMACVLVADYKLLVVPTSAWSRQMRGWP
jgi:enoyl-CoA hydratase/carnithine racemase